MGFTVELHNFSKKHNSTKPPLDFDNPNTFDCVLLDNCTITNPAIKFHFTTHGEACAMIKMNYCHIPDFNRYYFITEWEAVSNCWIAHCEVDVLATYKSYIGASTQYVTRAAAEYNGNIMDTIYPTTADVHIVQHETAVNALFAGYNSGCYVLGIINSLSYGVGSVCYYIVDSTNLRKIMGKLFNTVDWLEVDLEEISAELTKALFNPMQYIASCKMIPTVYGGELINNETFGAPSALQIGWWTFENNIDALLVEPTKTVIKASYNLSIPKHPQQDVGAYLNMSPYSRYSLELPFYGRVAIDPSYIKDSSNLHVDVKIDLITGDCLYVLKNAYSDGDIIARLTTNVGVDIKMAQLTTDVLGVATSAINTVANTASAVQRMDVGGAISSVANGIESTIKTAMPQLSTVGGVGSVLQTGETMKLIGEFYKIVDDDVTHRGKPLCKDVKINTLSGYVMCADAHIGIAGATSGEVDKVVSLMNGGFYYE